MGLLNRIFSMFSRGSRTTTTTTHPTTTSAGAGGGGLLSKVRRLLR